MKRKKNQILSQREFLSTSSACSSNIVVCCFVHDKFVEIVNPSTDINHHFINAATISLFFPLQIIFTSWSTRCQLSSLRLLTFLGNKISCFDEKTFFFFGFLKWPCDGRVIWRAHTTRDNAMDQQQKLQSCVQITKPKRTNIGDSGLFFEAEAAHHLYCLPYELHSHYPSKAKPIVI